MSADSSSETVIHSGELYVQERNIPVLNKMELGWKFAAWKQRWFSLTETTFSCMERFGRPPLYQIRLAGAHVELCSNAERGRWRTSHALKMHTPSHTYVLCASSSDKIKEWIDYLTDVLELVEFKVQKERSFEARDMKLQANDQIFKVGNYQFHLPKLTKTVTSDRFLLEYSSLELTFEKTSYSNIQWESYETELLKQFAEDQFYSLNPSADISSSTEHSKINVVKNDSSKWLCWKTFGQASEKNVYNCVLLRKFLPPCGITSEVIIINATVPKSAPKSDIDQIISRIIESMGPEKCQYDLQGISQKVRSLEVTDEYFKWANNSFRIRPFPRHCLDSARKSFEYSLDSKAGTNDLDFTMTFDEVFTDLKSKLTIKSEEEATKLLNRYLASFLDGGFDDLTTFTSWCERRSKRSLAEQENFDVIVGQIINLRVGTTTLYFSTLKADTANEWVRSLGADGEFVCRLVHANFSKFRVSPEAIVSIAISMLRHPIDLYQLASAECISHMLSNEGTKDIVVKSKYVSNVISKLPRQGPYKINTPKTETAAPVEDDASSRRSSSIGHSSTGPQNVDYDEVSKAVSGYLNLKEGVRSKRKFVRTEANHVILSDDKPGGEKARHQLTERIDLFQCSKIEANMEESQFTLKTLSGSKILVAPDRYTFAIWVHALSHCKYYTGPKPHGFSDPHEYEKYRALVTESPVTSNEKIGDRTSHLLAPLSNVKNLVGAGVGAISFATSHQPQLELAPMPLVYVRGGPKDVDAMKRLRHQVVYLSHATHLVNLCEQDQSLRSQLTDNIEFIIYMLNHLSSKDKRVVTMTLRLYNMMASENPTKRTKLVSAGVLQNIIAFFDDIRNAADRNSQAIDLTLDFYTTMFADAAIRALAAKGDLRNKIEILITATSNETIKKKASDLLIKMQ